MWTRAMFAKFRPDEAIEEMTDLILIWETQTDDINLYHHHNIVSAWALIPLANHKPACYLSPQALKNVTSPPKQTESPDNSNMYLVA